MRILGIVIFLVGLSGCDFGPYEVLKDKYPLITKNSLTPVDTDSVTFTSNSTKGAYFINNTASVWVGDQHVWINLGFPVSIFHDPVQIPVDVISGCNKTCFDKDNWDANLLLGDDGIEISIDNSEDILEWCYSSDLPIISGNVARNWMYSGGNLPSRNSYIQVSREKYEDQKKSTCRGF